MKSTPIVGWIFIALGSVSSIAKALGRNDIAIAIDEVLGNLQILCVGTGAGILHYATPPNVNG